MDESTKEALVSAVKSGLPYVNAARVAGIGQSTFHRWMQYGREQKTGEYVEFWESIKKARDEAIKEIADTILSIGKNGNWQALAWWLERRFPDDWSSNAKELRTLQKQVEDMLAKLKEAGFE